MIAEVAAPDAVTMKSEVNHTSRRAANIQDLEAARTPDLNVGGEFGPMSRMGRAEITDEEAETIYQGLERMDIS